MKIAEYIAELAESQQHLAVWEELSVHLDSFLGDDVDEPEHKLPVLNSTVQFVRKDVLEDLKAYIDKTVDDTRAKIQKLEELEINVEV